MVRISQQWVPELRWGRSHFLNGFGTTGSVVLITGSSMEKVPARQLLLTEMNVPGVCRNRCTFSCQRCCPLGNAALQKRLLMLPGLASSLEISRWPHPVRLSLQQEHLGNFRKPCITSEGDKHWNKENTSDGTVGVRRSTSCATKVRKEQNAWLIF